MKKNYVLSLFVVMLLLFTVVLVSCDDPDVDPLKETVDLNLAVNYVSGGALMNISYNLEDSYTGLDGVTYTKGDLTPAWRAIGEKLNINFHDVATVNDASTNAQFTRLQTEGFAGVDIVNGTGQNIAKEAVQNHNFVDIAKYLNQMPNLKAFLAANPSVKVSLTAADGGIYFTPYFDGLNELEQMFLVRTDWVQEIIDAVSPSFDTTVVTNPISSYTRRAIPAAGINTTITVANANGTTRSVNKKYTKNILTVLQELPASATGADYANALRTHITAAYSSQGYAKLSDVYVGTDACYDTDELIALLYVVKNNPQYLTKTALRPAGLDTVQAYVPRENAGNRVRNLIRGTEMFGLRGVFSRYEYIYNDGTNLQDIRFDTKFRDGIDDLSSLYADGLIPSDLTTSKNWRTEIITSSSGFMMYDYNDSSTSAGELATGRAKDADLHFQAILPPVVDWKGNGQYFHFSESVRSVKNEAWGILKTVEADEVKLNRALKLVDDLYDYSTDESVGTIHLYGPKGYTDGTIAYGGELADKVYKLSDACKAEIVSKASGNRINYLRQYVGATLPIGHVRSMGLEYQGLSDDGLAGIARINTAVAAGTFKLAGISNPTDHWFDLAPTFLPFTSDESTRISSNGAIFTGLYADNQLYKLVQFGFKGGLGANPPMNWEAYNSLFVITQGSVTLNYYNDIYIKAVRDAYARGYN
ncbi:MAG: hypothetical protein LBV58_02490 [Acholeplasmatales bacterium]|jgi:putative aldouronate transport system substrate-binding protein|nr:hypothetical protein [Acholeplasmatales bacterium]